MQASFPEEYTKRAEEAREEEKETDVASPKVLCTDRHRGAESAPVGKGGPSSKDFACDACDMLVYKPLISNCGHVVCKHHVDLSDHGTKGHCPACHAAFHGGEAVCTQLWDWMTRVFPEQCEARRLQYVSSEAAVAEEEKKTQHAGQSDEDNSMESEEDRDYPDDFTHFGVGCDVCGQYPILGKRYKCLDCPESVGYDLCRGCMKDTHTMVGRFNQKHEPHHRLELVPPLMTKLHTIKELHPDLDYNRLLSLIEMAWEDHPSNQQQQDNQVDDDDDDDDELQQQQEEDESSEPMTDGSVMMRPRGPRPRHQE